MAPSDTSSDLQRIREQANAIVRRFNAVVTSHRRLMPDALAALERGELVTIMSGTPERPVIELTLSRIGTDVTSSVKVDATLPAGMRAHAEKLAERFRAGELAARASERNS